MRAIACYALHMTDTTARATQLLTDIATAEGVDLFDTSADPAAMTPVNRYLWTQARAAALTQSQLAGSGPDEILDAVLQEQVCSLQVAVRMLVAQN